MPLAKEWHYILVLVLIFEPPISSSQESFAVSLNTTDKTSAAISNSLNISEARDNSNTASERFLSNRDYEESTAVEYNTTTTGVPTEGSFTLKVVRHTPRALPVAVNEPTTEPPTVEPEATPEAWPEPGPNWPVAYKEWGVAWELHVYLFATIFLGFAVYSGYYIVISLYVGLNKRYLALSLNAVMFLLGITRSFSLFFDPYLQGNLINNVHAMRVIWSLASPCLTSADCLVILALVETAKISLAPQRLQKFSVILQVIILHFFLVLSTDFVVSKYVEAKAMLVFCQTFFIVWGTLLGVGYAILGYKLDRKLFGHKEVKNKKDLLYIRLIYASAFNNFVLCGMFLYSSIGDFGVYSELQYVDSWSWWALQTCYRVSEVSSAILVFTVRAKRKRLKKTSKQVTGVDGVGESSSPDASDSEHICTDIPSAHAEKHAKQAARQGKKDRRTSMFSDLHEAKRAAYKAKRDLHEKPIEEEV